MARARRPVFVVQGEARAVESREEGGPAARRRGGRQRPHCPLCEQRREMTCGAHTSATASPLSSIFLFSAFSNTAAFPGFFWCL